MSDQFIRPNWHVIFVHYPLALLGMGIVIELLSVFWRRSSVRYAGRWMVLIGALACIPTLTMGLYAFRDVVAPGPMADETWQHLSARSPWTGEQWESMSHHIWYSAGGTVIAILASFIFLSCSDSGRRRMYWPSLVLMLAALSSLGVGAWHAGEAVYVHGVAVNREAREQSHNDSSLANDSAIQSSNPLPASTSSSPASQPGLSDAIQNIGHQARKLAQSSAKSLERNEIGYYVPPLELHLLLAGFAVAISLAAFGVTIRRWKVMRATSVLSQPVTVEVPEYRLRPDLVDRPARVVEATVQVPVVPEIFPARLWLWALLFALATAASGVGMTRDWKLKVLTEPMHNRFALDETQRVFSHVLVGLSLALALLFGAILTRLARRHRLLTVLMMLIAIVAVSAQLWLGILLLFDSSHGPLTSFN